PYRFDSLLQFVQVPAQIAAPARNFQFYLVRSLAHSTFSLTLPIVCRGTASTRFSRSLPILIKTAATIPVKIPITNAASQPGSAVARARTQANRTRPIEQIPASGPAPKIPVGFAPLLTCPRTSALARRNSERIRSSMFLKMSCTTSDRDRFVSQLDI